MKRYFALGIVILFSFIVTGCASTSRYPTVNLSLTKEDWQRAIDVNPMRWTRSASMWFLTGNPAATLGGMQRVPSAAALSSMRVKVPNFYNIKINGSFKVQIFQSDTNSVYVYGPNSGVRQLSIEARGGTLCITQVGKNAASRCVLVRIGVRCLRDLTQMGSGTIEAIYLESDFLRVRSTGTGNIFLSGNMNIRCIDHLGGGCIIVVGANTPDLTITTAGVGAVNVSGNVGIRKIKHRGAVNINIIGANAPCLKISSEGRGKIGIKGQVNLQEIRANCSSCIYICGVDSCYAYVYACDRARIGLSGRINDLYVQTSGYADFKGRYLCARNAFVRTRDYAHINVTATDRIFASATQNSSVYFFGSPNVLSQFVAGNAIVMPIYGGFGMKNCPIPAYPVVVDYKAERIPPTPYYPYTKPSIPCRPCGAG